MQFKIQVAHAIASMFSLGTFLIYGMYVTYTIGSIPLTYSLNIKIHDRLIEC